MQRTNLAGYLKSQLDNFSKYKNIAQKSGQKTPKTKKPLSQSAILAVSAGASSDSV